MGRGAEGMSKARKPSSKAGKAKDAPCEACAGFTIPARRVAAVARDRKGRFKRKPQQRGLF